MISTELSDQEFDPLMGFLCIGLYRELVRSFHDYQYLSKNTAIPARPREFVFLSHLSLHIYIIDLVMCFIFLTYMIIDRAGT